MVFSLKSILPGSENAIETEQISFILGSNYLISFQERNADHFNHVRKRIREDIGILRERSPDYLLFLLLESILDNFFKTIENIEQQADHYGNFDIKTDPSPSNLSEIELFKRQLHLIKRTINPIKDFLTTLEREGFSFIDKRHIKYFYELKDLCLSLIDNCDKTDLRLESSINMFFSIQGHRMNQVMKTLTVVATIFIPLTFIAGIYGMNFANMPELNWEWGYFGIWLVMIGIFVFMLRYFKKKKWY